MLKLLLILFCISLVAAVDVRVDPEPPRTNSTAGPPTTSKPTPTTKPTITTVKPTTTSSTTVKPTTTSPTTVKPTTPPAPTPAPTPLPPVPEPTMGSWMVNYTGTNNTCIILDLTAQFEILQGNETLKINLPNNSIASGNCTNKVQQYVKLEWETADHNVSNSLELVFKLNNSKFDVEKINLLINWPGHLNVSHKKPEFFTPLQNSYKCAKAQSLNLTTETSTETAAYLYIVHVQFEAFTNTTGHIFASATDCEASMTPDIVPIVVGCVLAALVVMVLIAYLIGRRRCQARGYLSM